MNKITKILTVVVTCLCIGYFSGMVTRESVEIWYPTLVKPSFNPPNWLFAPVWSMLYAMMGVAAGLVWHRIDTDRINVRKGLQFFAIQLVLNFLWSYLFFGLHNPLLALAELAVLWLMIFETYIVFRKVDKIAGMLLLPYLAWVTFAGILNAAICWLNR
ncbi:benzodiazepine receptor TspO [Flavobacterium cauense R2A-7]|uniref:TspO/MBR related protein n=1 Tax=Flavobacterium cauense R2A-7 TaxID=1341154 RepID=V6S4T2_9FLAO|nr:TspO/MBR family protein [Flavobacterium cauense]ESU21683.1 benzodiazepine receptor TspO [Flavobacterium cauense R2A-7]KGO80920.1 CrtK [Flavobacterium cauense R2A-7]TWI12829.1 TspO/MBR related protein [Flavobacterium cauense R2A-7]